MKKLLAICSIFFTVCASFTSCGANNRDADHTTEEKYESNYQDGTRAKKADDYVSGVIEGAEDAGEDIINGAGDAVQDAVDGLDGEKDENKTTTSNRAKNRR